MSGVCGLSPSGVNREKSVSIKLGLPCSQQLTKTAKLDDRHATITISITRRLYIDRGNITSQSITELLHCVATVVSR